MRKIIILLAASSISVTTGASAATWYLSAAGNGKTLFFFDADTIERSPESVTLWIKTVETTKPAADGSWSTALLWKFNCSARTVQSLSLSTYNNSGEFIESYNKPAPPMPVVPDSTGEAMLKISCQPNFPRDTSGNYYFKIDGNDLFKVRDRWVEWVNYNRQIDLAPK